MSSSPVYGAALDLDDRQLLLAVVGQAVLRTLGYVDGLTGVGEDLLAVDGAGGDAEDDDPVPAAVLVGLVGQATAGFTWMRLIL